FRSAVIALELAQRAAPVAFRRLDLDDVGPVQRQQHRGMRPGHALREVEHGDAVIRAFDHEPAPPGRLNVRLPAPVEQGPTCREAMRMKKSYVNAQTSSFERSVMEAQLGATALIGALACPLSPCRSPLLLPRAMSPPRWWRRSSAA